MDKKHSDIDIINDKKDIIDIKDSMNKKSIEIWEDLVNIKDLLIALCICIITTFTGYLLAPNKAPWPLLFGLIGAFIGFIISSFIIKPKRDFEESNMED